MMYMLRKIPKRTDKVVYADYTFEDMDVDNNKIYQVLSTRNIKKPDVPVKPVPPEAYSTAVTTDQNNNAAQVL